MKKYALAALALAYASGAAATTITFDEFPADNANGAIPSARYSGLGVTFVGTDDGSTWGGNSAGNPGNWGLEGTNGAAFSGFNGDSYSQTLTFASNIGSFSLDASRSNGSVDGTILLQGFLGGVLQSSTSATFGGINTWSTLSLTGTFDQIVYSGTGSSFHPFGVDNLVFDGATGTPEPATWALMLAGFGAVGFAMRSRRTLAVKLG